jgi:TatD DNase family protein
MWLDSHAHLTATEFDTDRDAVLARASAAGVETIIAIGSGYGVEHNTRATELAARDGRVFATVGVHPHDAALLEDEGRKSLERWLGLPRVVAVGECGLDYHYDHSPRSVQRQVFAEQVSLARQHALPVAIHVRDDGEEAYEDLLEIWLSEGRGQLQGVLHCFTGSLAFAERALDAGFYVSFSGILTFKKDRGLRDVAAALPLERLLVETDSPLLAPEGFRGKRNEPAHIALVGRALATLHDVPLEELARITAANARSLFRLDAAPPAQSRDAGAA